MASQIAGRVVEQLSSRGGGGNSGSSAVDAVRAAANADNGVMTVEQAAAHAERLQAQGIRPSRNGGSKS
jgi:hypothetical protein